MLTRAGTVGLVGDSLRQGVIGGVGVHAGFEE